MRLSRVLPRVALMLLLPAGSRLRAQDKLVDIKGLSPHELRVQSFVITQPQDIQIQATGADDRGSRSFGIGPFKWERNRDDSRGYWRGSAWILDARSREVVWRLDRATTERDDELRSFNGRVRLNPGTYEAYYASYSGNQTTQILGTISSRRRQVRYDDGGLSDDFRFAITGTGRQLNPADLTRTREDFTNNAFVMLHSPRHESTQRVGFSLDKPLDVEVYAIGEARDDESFDYGWIINTDTHEKVWKFDGLAATDAGGAEKNRYMRVTRTLPAGRYAAFFASDDSHDPLDWNAAPPNDPDFWGLTVRVKNPADRASVKTYAYESAPLGNAIVALTGLHDSESRSYGFTISKPMDIRVYAIGEGRGERMYDYGWITDANTHRRIWEMNYNDTEHAGGDAKNRVVDRVLHMVPGNYIVSFVTDDSHSYGSWNSAPPMDGEYWGISLLPASGALDKSAVSRFDDRSDANVLARLVRMKNGSERRMRFTLDHDANLRVYAIGEGSGDEMNDYGWIEDLRSGSKVWEMTYRSTRNAGGADKNRLFDNTVHLRGGEYVLHFRTDDSHAYGNWNSDPPEDAESWGITVYRPGK